MFSMLMLLTVAGICLLASNAGLRWSALLLTRISGGSITLANVQGTLLGPLSVQTLTIARSDLHVTASDVELDWQPAALLSGKLELTTLTAGKVEVRSPKKPLPADLRPPLTFTIGRLVIAELRMFSMVGGTPDIAATDLTASVSSDGNRYVLKALNTNFEYGHLTASGSMAATHPYALSGQAQLLGLEDFIDPDTEAAHIVATASGDLLRLSIDAQGSGAGLSGTAQAQLTPYATFPLAALILQIQGLDPHAFAPAAPRAKLTLQTDLRTASSGVLAGNVLLRNDTPTSYDQGGLPLLAASARATLSADLLKFDTLQLQIKGGATISGNFAWQRLQARSSAELIIHQLNPAALDTRLRSARLNGNMQISGDNKVQRGTLTLADGKLHLDASLLKSANTITLQRLSLARGQAELSGQGELQLGERQAYRFDGVLAHFNLAEFMPRAPRSELNATLALAGVLKPYASGTLDFTMHDSRLSEHELSGSGQMEFSDGKRGKGIAEIRLGDNILSVKGGIGSAQDRLQLDLSAPAMEQLGTGYGGKLMIHADLTDNLALGTVSADGHDLLLPGGHQLASLSATASLNSKTLALTMLVNDYRVEAKTVLRSLQLEVHGSMAQHELSVTTQLNNDQQLLLRAGGGLDTGTDIRNTQWHGRLTELSGTGALPFRLLAGIPVTLSSKHISLAAAELTVAGGQISLGNIEWTPQHWSSRGSFTAIGLRLSQAEQPSLFAHESQDALRLGGAWDISSAAQLTGNFRIARESGDLLLGNPPFALGLEKLQLTARASGGEINAELSATGQRLGNLHANIALPLMHSGAAWSVNTASPLSGHVLIAATDLAWLGAMTEGELMTGGRLTLDADVSGTSIAPRLLGQMHGEDLQLAWLGQGMRLEHGGLDARFDKDTLHIDTLSFSAPHDEQPHDPLLAGLVIARTAGTLNLTGQISINGGDVAISAYRLPMTQRKDRWIIISGSGHARLEKSTLNLDGTITADAGLINQPVIDRPQLSDDVLITGQPTYSRRGLRFSLDASLDLGEHFFLRAAGLEARLAGRLNMREAPGQAPHFTGSIAARDASFEAYGQHLTVERGIVNFAGPLYDPGLNLLALRKGLSVVAGVAVTGTALHPVVRLVSTPEVPDTEKLSWIVLGRPPDASGTDISLLLAATEGMVGSGSSGITGKLKQVMGVDQLSLRANDNNALNIQAINADPLSNQIAVVGKRLSTRAFLTYEQGVTATAGVTKLTYILSPRVNIVTQAGFDNAIDIFYTFSFE